MIIFSSASVIQFNKIINFRKFYINKWSHSNYKLINDTYKVYNFFFIDCIQNEIYLKIFLQIKITLIFISQKTITLIFLSYYIYKTLLWYIYFIPQSIT